MRIEFVDTLGVVNLHRLQSLKRFRACLRFGHGAVRAQGLHNLVANGHHRVERELGVLQHHRNASATQSATLPGRAVQQVDAVEGKPFGRYPAFRRGESQNGAAGLGFARTGLTHNAQTFTPQSERHTSHDFHPAAIAVREGHVEVFHHQHGRSAIGCAAHLTPFGSSASRKPSPSRLKARLIRKMAAPGAAATHHWSSTY